MGRNHRPLTTPSRPQTTRPQHEACPSEVFAVGGLQPGSPCDGEYHAPRLQTAPVGDGRPWPPLDTIYGPASASAAPRLPRDRAQKQKIAAWKSTLSHEAETRRRAMHKAEEDRTREAKKREQHAKAILKRWQMTRQAEEEREQAAVRQAQRLRAVEKKLRAAREKADRQAKKDQLDQWKQQKQAAMKARQLEDAAQKSLVAAYRPQKGAVRSTRLPQVPAREASGQSLPAHSTEQQPQSGTLQDRQQAKKAATIPSVVAGSRSEEPTQSIKSSRKAATPSQSSAGTKMQRVAVERWRVQRAEQQQRAAEKQQRAKKQADQAWKERCRKLRQIVQKRAMLKQQEEAAAEGLVDRAVAAGKSEVSEADPEAAAERLRHSEEAYKLLIAMQRRQQQEQQQSSSQSPPSSAVSSPAGSIVGATSSESEDESSSSSSTGGAVTKSSGAPQQQQPQEQERYRVFQVLAESTIVRSGFSRDTAAVGKLRAGQEVRVVEQRVNVRGQTRLRLAAGSSCSWSATQPPKPLTDSSTNGTNGTTTTTTSSSSNGSSGRPTVVGTYDSGEQSIEAEQQQQSGWVSQTSWPGGATLLQPARWHEKQIALECARAGATESGFQFREGGGDGSCWDKRFAEQAEQGNVVDEWYITYQSSPELRALIARAIPEKAACVVQVGCGNSRLAPGLADDGWTRIVNVDISTTALNTMRHKYMLSHPQMGFIHGDATNLGRDWKDGMIDAVLDKGTLQSLLLLRDGVERCRAFAREMHRVLRPGGVMIQIMGRPGMQLYIQLPELGWETVRHAEIPREGIGGSAHVYTFVKRSAAMQAQVSREYSEECAKREARCLRRLQQKEAAGSQGRGGRWGTMSTRWQQSGAEAAVVG